MQNVEFLKNEILQKCHKCLQNRGGRIIFAVLNVNKLLITATATVLPSFYAFRRMTLQMYNDFIVHTNICTIILLYIVKFNIWHTFYNCVQLKVMI